MQAGRLPDDAERETAERGETATAVRGQPADPLPHGSATDPSAALAKQTGSAIGSTAWPEPAGVPPAEPLQLPKSGLSISYRTAKRYGLAIGFVAVATLAEMVLEATTGKFSAFPFYAAVVASAWFGIGPGVLSFLMSIVVVADFWTPTRYSLEIEEGEWPSFAAFIVCALMSLAWSSQRRRAEYALEATVQQRTADLVRANAALKAEMAEREAAENERKRTERALRDAEAELARTLRLATMAELAAAIAHEINQPLAAITANGSACQRSLEREPPLLDNAREAAACIVADGHRAGDVIARIRALFNKEQPRQQPLNVNDVIRHVLELSRGAIERERVTVRTELAAPAPWVMADPVQLQQVMVNLVTNALEAMTGAADWPRVLTVRSEVDHGGNLAVTVEDTGSGLDAEQVSHIFESFYTTKPGGIGVGLAISRSIIEAHGGSMWAAPGPSQGAKVGFTLPLGAAANR
jgi:signal transduction histidine kinase